MLYQHSSFVRILIFSDGAYIAPPAPFSHAPPTAYLFPVAAASPSYNELSFGVKKKTRAFSV